MAKISNNLRSAENLIIVSGLDINKGSEVFLREAINKKSSITLALDSSAVKWCSSNNFIFQTIEDILDEESILKARKQASVYDKKWYSSIDDNFNSQKIHFPKNDRDCLWWFWRDYFIAWELCTIFSATNLKHIYYTSFKNIIPQLYYNNTNIIKHYISKKLNIQNFVYENVLDFRNSFIEHKSEKSIDVHDKILIAINSHEYKRFRNFLKLIQKAFPKRILLIFISQPTKENEIHSYSINLCSYKAFHEFENIDFFKNVYEGLIRKSSHDLHVTDILHTIPNQLEHLFVQRWPNMLSRYSLIERLLSNGFPKCILTSTLSDLESQLPTIFGQNRGIDTYGLPHSNFVSTKNPSIQHKKILITNKLQEKSFHRLGICKNRFTYCKDIISKDEYGLDSNGFKEFFSSILTFFLKKLRLKKRTILVLVNPYTFEGQFNNLINYKEHSTAVKTISSIPHKLRNKLSILIKGHPAFHSEDLSLLSKNGVIILSNQHSLNSLLSETDLVIALNYSGSAIVPVVESKKPIIHFWAGELTREKYEKVDPVWFPDLITDSGITVNSKNFWNIIQKFHQDRKFNYNLRKKVIQFRQTYINNLPYRLLSDIFQSSVHPPFD